MLNRSLASAKFFQTPLPGLLAFAFVLLGYSLGVYLLFSNYWFINLLGLALTAESLIISAYLIDEFSNWRIFKSPKMNERSANVMAWINGSCYTTYQAIRDQHMKHQIDGAYEHADIFSNLASIKYPWLNLLFLNFLYHNAHHEQPILPWHRLLEFHKKRYDDTMHLAINPMSHLFKTYHTNRIKRVVSHNYGVISDVIDGAVLFVGGRCFIFNSKMKA